MDILADLFMESSGESPKGLEKLSELTYRKRPSEGTMAESVNRQGNPNQYEGKAEGKGEFSYSVSKRKIIENGTPKVKIKIVIPKSLERHVSMSKIVDYAIESFLEELKSAVEE